MQTTIKFNNKSILNKLTLDVDKKALRSAGIYEIGCTATNKKYIGSSTNIGRRLAEHVRDLEKGIHSGKEFQEDWNKYKDCFYLKVLESCGRENLFEREQYYLNQYHAIEYAKGKSKLFCKLTYNSLSFAGLTPYQNNFLAMCLKLINSDKLNYLLNKVNLKLV